MPWAPIIRAASGPKISSVSAQDTQVLRDMLVQQLGVQPAQLTPSSRIKEDLGADSLTEMEIMLAVEDRFQVTIPDEEWENVSTIADTCDVIARHLPAAKTAN